MRLVAVFAIFICFLSFASSRAVEKKEEKRASDSFAKHVLPANVMKKLADLGQKLEEKVVDQLQKKLLPVNKVDKNELKIDEAKSLIMKELAKIKKERKSEAVKVEKRRGGSNDKYYYDYSEWDDWYSDCEYGCGNWDNDNDGFWSNLLQYWEFVGDILHSIANEIDDFDMDRPERYKKMLMKELFKMKKASTKAFAERETSESSSSSDYEPSSNSSVSSSEDESSSSSSMSSSSSYSSSSSGSDSSSSSYSSSYDEAWWDEFWAYWDDYDFSDSSVDRPTPDYDRPVIGGDDDRPVIGGDDGRPDSDSISGSMGQGSGPQSSQGPESSQGPQSSQGPESSQGPQSNQGPQSSQGPQPSSESGMGPRAVNLKVTREELEYLEKALKKRLGQMRKK